MSPTGLQLALLGGVLMAAGLVLLVARLTPARPDLADALDRLSPDPRRMAPATGGEGSSTADRVGRWGMRLFPGVVWGRAPVQQLALLRISTVRFYGEKLLFGMLGLVMVPVLSVLLAVLGWRLPVVVPVVVTVGFAVAMFFLPDYNVRDDAKRGRTEFARALGAYADLVALERNAGSGPRQALEVAAAVGDSWVFRRLREELAFSSWSGEQPWQALRRVSQELGVGPGRHRAVERGRGCPDLRPAPGTVRGDAGRDAHRRSRVREHGRREDVDPDEPPWRDLPGDPGRARPAARHGRMTRA
jgi:hypothetical protein